MSVSDQRSTSRKGDGAEAGTNTEEKVRKSILLKALKERQERLKTTSRQEPKRPRNDPRAKRRGIWNYE